MALERYLDRRLAPRTSGMRVTWPLLVKPIMSDDDGVGLSWPGGGPRCTMIWRNRLNINPAKVTESRASVSIAFARVGLITVVGFRVVECICADHHSVMTRHPLPPADGD